MQRPTSTSHDWTGLLFKPERCSGPGGFAEMDGHSADIVFKGMSLISGLISSNGQISDTFGEAECGQSPHALF